MTAAAVTLLGALAAIATLLMLFQRSPVKAAMLMLTALLCTAGIYLALSAQLLSALQVILYAGAVMTLFIVALTVTPLAAHDRPPAGAAARTLGLAAAAVLLMELLKAGLVYSSLSIAPGFEETGALGIARALFGRFVFQFELLGLVIMAGIAAAAALALKRRPQP